MTEQDTLALTAECRVCRGPIPYAGVGRPASLCDSCYPVTYPPRKRRHEVPSPLSRSTDGATSREAAASVNGAAVEARILLAFERWGPMTDDELVATCDGYGPTLKTARSRLTKAGCLVRAGLGTSDRGRAMTRWAVAP